MFPTQIRSTDRQNNQRDKTEARLFWEAVPTEKGWVSSYAV
jgi:hypothetical protein